MWKPESNVQFGMFLFYKICSTDNALNPTSKPERGGCRTLHPRWRTGLERHVDNIQNHVEIDAGASALSQELVTEWGGGRE